MHTSGTAKLACITGANGQDGSYLAELLLKKGYKVIGVKRRSSTNNLWRLESILNHENFEVVEGDITDSASVYNLVDKYKPDELYNLAAQSHVHTSFEQPQYTTMVDYIGVINILEAVRKLSPKTKVYQAGTSEEFGSNVDEDGFQDENTEFKPQSPYAIAKVAAHQVCKLYREAYGLFVCVGILMNHESPKRGEEFVTRKITKWIGENYWRMQKQSVQICGSFNSVTPPIKNEDKLNLGNLDASRDWGHAKDFVEAMYMMLQYDKPDDYVVATGETHTIRDFLDMAFKRVGIDDWTSYVYINPKFVRPAEVEYLRGKYKKAKEILGWTPSFTFNDLVEEMVLEDVKIYANYDLNTHDIPGLYSNMIQKINISKDFKCPELGEKGPYHKFPNPVISEEK
ncbi:GDP-mannose 4,6-dehydratase [Candidatus Pacearchaeota archaeon]|nr:GDP-mannose 4,6-dehydratase [Candidatus Pacearchaeota archaeon]